MTFDQKTYFAPETVHLISILRARLCVYLFYIYIYINYYLCVFMCWMDIFARRSDGSSAVKGSLSLYPLSQSFALSLTLYFMRIQPTSLPPIHSVSLDKFIVMLKLLCSILFQRTYLLNLYRTSSTNRYRAIKRTKQIPY
jgi:hypothetical protein